MCVCPKIGWQIYKSAYGFFPNNDLSNTQRHSMAIVYYISCSLRPTRRRRWNWQIQYFKSRFFTTFL
jgi:hypothetical protein